MPRKAFLVQVELEVKSITCPGVWLCSNGQVSLQIYLLDSCVQTGCYRPYFPIDCDESFGFSKTLALKEHRLIDLQRALSKEWIYIELVQWQSCEVGTVLAWFQITLDQLLFPTPLGKGGLGSSVEMDLLMDPSKNFPGIIAPKVEISTKTSIEETLYSQKLKRSHKTVTSPILATSEKTDKKMGRKVCHSIPYSIEKRLLHSQRQVKADRRPPFRYKKAEDDLILRKPTYDPENDLKKDAPCSCMRDRLSRSMEGLDLVDKSPRKFARFDDVNRRRTPFLLSCNINPNSQIERNDSLESLENLTKNELSKENLIMCSCGVNHRDNCLTCEKYRAYFNKASTSSPRHQSPKRDSCPRQLRSSLFKHKNQNSPKCGRQCSRMYPDHYSICCEEKTSNLAEKLHDRLTKTLSSGWEKTGNFTGHLSRCFDQNSFCCDEVD